jgi:hypothetical protein
MIVDVLLTVDYMCACVGGLMSYTTHASHMRELFGKLGVDTTKLTHELRIFAAQLLYEMGVPIEVRPVCHMLSRQKLCSSAPVSTPAVAVFAVLQHIPVVAVHYLSCGALC